MAKVRPLNDKILIERSKAEEKTKGGIILPDGAKEKPKEGVIVAVGDGRFTDSGERVPFQVKKGDRVLFKSYSGTDVKLDGKEYILMSEEDILAVIE
ncbi:MAG: co-chaperone GroES [Planctomycetaceae bacterium]|nr:10 kDa chaperonin [Planctomycetota bacterium]MCQ3948327.1 co-chaperone GroES [Planctomycetota bacterium]NUO16597.1 co-chaperone GroES [Planctomycetaceae bacterium]GIK52234.1 MAG: 10 kDa chaperonin [Planctomycetota bacterium]HRJ79506.1 co-chaperone GroES [Planctomycetota bacterium]